MARTPADRTIDKAAINSVFIRVSQEVESTWLSTLLLSRPKRYDITMQASALSG